MIVVCTLMTGEVKGRNCLIISVYPFWAFYLLVRKCLILCGIKQMYNSYSFVGS